MRALKGLVVALGLAIIVATSVLVTLIAMRAGTLAEGDAAAPPVPLALPAGARVLESRLGDGRLLLRLALPGGGERIVVFDAASGRPVARYDLAPEDPRP
jgi:hypothetical protein